jgi:serine protease
MQTDTFRRQIPRIVCLVALSGGMLTSSPSSAHVPESSTDRFIVYYKDAKPSFTSAPQNDLARAGNLAGVSLRAERKIATGGYLVRVQSPQAIGEAQARDIVRAIAAQPSVEYVEPDTVFETPADPAIAALLADEDLWPMQWNMFEPVGGIGAPAAWKKASGKGVVVAVVDSGVTRHSDLDSQQVPGYDFISDAERAGDGDGADPDPSDEGSGGDGLPSSWHGTHTSGTVVARNNGRGVIGVAYDARLLPVRVSGAGGISYLSDIVDGLVWAAGGRVEGIPGNSQPAHVVSMSLGGGSECGRSMQAAIDMALANRVVVVVSAGNNNTDASGRSPANCEGVITVAATTRLGGKASYSNFGKAITISAPGGERTMDGILSTYNAGIQAPGEETYATSYGTSMATPHVAGVAALMLSANPRLTPAQVKQALIDSARALPIACDEGCGAGIVDASGAVDAALALIGSETAAPR